MWKLLTFTHLRVNIFLFTLLACVSTHIHIHLKLCDASLQYISIYMSVTHMLYLKAVFANQDTAFYNLYSYLLHLSKYVKLSPHMQPLVTHYRSF